MSDPASILDFKSGGTSQIAFLAGGGEMGALMRAHDWTRSPLGPPGGWPQSLKTAVRIMLTSRQPIWIGWGTELIYLYNDPYKSIIGGKHPWALGRPTMEVWREIWSDIGPMLATARQGDEGTYVEEQLLIMERSGYPEETYYTFSYSPIPDDDGRTGGIICANTDDTQRVIGERQLRLLRELAAANAEARTVEQACRESARALAADPRDLPFAMIYLAEPDGRTVSLAATSGIALSHPAAPASSAVDGESPWPFAEVIRGHEPLLIGDLKARFATEFPKGAWDHDPRQAALIPIPARSDTGRAGILVAGLNPFRLFDGSYRSFLGLAAGSIGASIANAQAYEEERRRAEALAEIDRAKTAFFANVSHEFRTPLTLMLGPIEDALNDTSAAGLSGIQRDRLDIAHRNSLRLLKLVNALLDFSRVEAGRARASYEPVDLSALTRDLASNFRAACDKAGLSLVIDCPPLPQPVYVDREMWEKIVLNLISNAFKFTLQGAVVVGLRQNDGAAELTVRDTGVGIPQTDLPRVFDRFHRVEGQAGRTHEGSGIGLSLVRELVGLHAGDVTVASTVGKGTTFTVLLPFGTAHLPYARIGAAGTRVSTVAGVDAFIGEALRWLPASNLDGAAEAMVTSNRQMADTAAGALALDGRRPRIVFADDNADMRDYVHRLLARAGAAIEVVADGQSARAAACRERPDLILSDVMMPKMDGIELLKQLRADPLLRTVPVILLSARAGEEARIEGLQSGADDYLIKPFSARELVARVRSNLQVAQFRRQADEAVREQTRTLEILNRVGATVSAELDLERAVQVVTDAATELTGAAFGSFFYNVSDEHGESYMLYALSGAPREAFSNFPLPRNSAIFAPTFKGEGIVRSGDILQDPRYGKSPPYYGMPKGHLPVRSYLAAPVISRSGEVLGGLFFGHPEAGVFTEGSERLLKGIAAQAAVAIDNGRLYKAAQKGEKQLKDLITALPAAVYMTDAQGRITFYNQAAVDLAGREPKIGSDEWCVTWKLYWPDGRPMRHDECPMAVALRENRPIRGAEAIAERPDGTRVPFLPYPTPLRDAAGDIIGGVNMLVDITERKAAEESLCRSEERLSAELAATKQLQAIGAEFVQEQKVESLYQKLVDAAAAIMRSEYASMQMLYPGRGKAGELRLLAFRGFNPEAARFWEWVRADSGSTCGVALRTGRRAIAPDVETCEFMAGTEDLAVYLQAGIHAVQTTPLISRSGRLLGMISTHWTKPHSPSDSDLRRLDLLARQAADLIERTESEERLRESEEQLRLATEAADVGLWDVDPINDRLFWPSRVKAMFGISADVPVSLADFYAGLHPEDRERTSAAFADAVDSGKRSLYDVEYRTIGKEDGITRWVAAKGRGVFDAHGTCIRVIGTAIDITARKRQENHQRLLLNELNHRVKNTLTTVQSMAMQTLRSSPDTLHAQGQIEARLIALSKAHDILTRENWEGASLRQVIEEAVAPYCGQSRDRFEIDGPNVWVPPKYALALAMGLHELCTNAVKYGSLSNDTGQVRIAWTIAGIKEPRELRMRWSESGGPAVKPPARRGFGSRLIQRGLKQDLGGEVRIEFAPAGVTCTIEAVLENAAGSE